MAQQIPISQDARADDVKRDRERSDGTHEVLGDLAFIRCAIVNVAFYGSRTAGDRGASFVGMMSYFAGGWRDRHVAAEFSQQVRGESDAGKSQDMSVGQARSAANADDAGERAQSVTATASGNVSLTEEKQEQVRKIFEGNRGNRATDSFGASAGAAVPRQVQLEALPPEITDITDRYRGDEYVIIQNRLIVAEPKSRRIVAIVPL